MTRKPKYKGTEAMNTWLYRRYWDRMYEVCAKMELEREKRCKAENEEWQKRNADK